jgi:hypothetical protein
LASGWCWFEEDQDLVNGGLAPVPALAGWLGADNWVRPGGFCLESGVRWASFDKDLLLFIRGLAVVPIMLECWPCRVRCENTGGTGGGTFEEDIDLVGLVFVPMLAC